MAVETAISEPDGPASPSPSRTPSVGRGETVIAPRVVETIATRVAASCEGVAEVVPAGGMRGFLRIGAHDPASASASVDQASTEVRLTVHLAYPAPAFTTAARVRANVVTELRRQTGLEPARVDITIPKLLANASRPRPRVR